MLKRLYGLCIALVLAAPALPALAASGTALGVDPAAEARGAQTRTLVVGADIFIGDRVVTDERGLVQILFTDTTRLVVGPRSELLIEDYLLRNDGSAGAFAVNALSGTFRFISGNAQKDRYRITTPTGTIGVRGTAMDLFVWGAATAALQLRGTSFYCPQGGGPDACEVLDTVCHWGLLESNAFNVRGHADDVPGADREQFRAWFQLAGSQGRLLRPFREPIADRCVNRPPPVGYIRDEGSSSSSSGSRQQGDNNNSTPPTPP